jgi:hypothetical protein
MTMATIQVSPTTVRTPQAFINYYVLKNNEYLSKIILSYMIAIIGR